MGLMWLSAWFWPKTPGLLYQSVEFAADGQPLAVLSTGVLS
jgi:hypothetical protein